MTFNGSNKTASAFQSYVDRVNWLLDAYGDGPEGPDMCRKYNLSERHLFGLVDRDGKPVEILNSFLTQMPLEMTNGEFFSVPDFFAAQLIDLQKEIDKSKFLIVSKNNSILNNIRIPRS